MHLTTKHQLRLAMYKTTPDNLDKADWLTEAEAAIKNNDEEAMRACFWGLMPGKPLICSEMNAYQREHYLNIYIEYSMAGLDHNAQMECGLAEAIMDAALI